MSDTKRRSKNCHVWAGLLLMMFILTGLALGQSETAACVHLFGRDLHELVKNASTPAQYRTLKGYYLDRKKSYEQEAEQEEEEWAEGRRQKAEGLSQSGDEISFASRLCESPLRI